jgi:bifunctional N-acetylglutamate synthase/kinase
VSAPPTNLPLSAGQTVLLFLESLGQRSEAELYLRLFRAVPRGRFALVAPSARTIRESAGALSEQLSFLRHLGLFAPLVVGSADPVIEEEFGWLLEAMTNEDLSPEVLDAKSVDCLARAEELLGEGRWPVFVLPEPDPEVLARLVGEVSPRKFVFLRGAGGLGDPRGGRLELSPGHYLPVHESGIGVINLRSDEAALLSGNFLPPEDVPWLARCRQVLDALEAKGSPASTVAIASPLSLIRELFTVRGEGTLVKLGAPIETHVSYATVDLGRISSLIEESFGRPVLSRLFQRQPLELFVEREYRGLALVESGLGESAYLTKFAVLPVARGEGLGQDLWWSVARSYPSFYWRSRSDNPINAWYATVCDGMHRTERWNVYYRGVTPERVPAIIADAITRPEDLAPLSSLS